MKIDRTESVLLIGTALLVAASMAFPAWLVDQLLFSMSRAIAVLGLLLLWRCGLISFGHGLFFGVGGYSLALLSRSFGISDLGVQLLTAIVLSSLVALVLGFVLRRYRGIFFAMLSLAFSMVLYGALVKSQEFGSTDGFSIPPATLLGSEIGSMRVTFFALSAIMFCVSAFATHRYLRTVAGSLCTAIRDNEIRAQYLGFAVERWVHINYVISAALTGAGGAMMAISIGQVDPDSMVKWTVSGELLFITILSGPGSVLAPVIGSIVFEFLRTYAMEVAPQGWHFIVGATLLAIILALPGGLWSLVDSTGAAILKMRHGAIGVFTRRTQHDAIDP